MPRRAAVEEYCATARAVEAPALSAQQQQAEAALAAALAEHRRCAWARGLRAPGELAAAAARRGFRRVAAGAEERLPAAGERRVVVAGRASAPSKARRDPKTEAAAPR